MGMNTITKIQWNLFLLFLFLIPSLVNAISLEGEILFRQNCSSCHTNGRNRILPEKNLRQETLIANGMNSVEAIQYQITNGKNGMPAFGGRLSEKEIEQIALYVFKESSQSFQKE